MEDSKNLNLSHTPEYNQKEMFSIIEKDLKYEINKLLWVKLPGNCKLKEAEEIACIVYNKIIHCWSEHL